MITSFDDNSIQRLEDRVTDLESQVEVLQHFLVELQNEMSNNNVLERVRKALADACMQL